MNNRKERALNSKAKRSNCSRSGAFSNECSSNNNKMEVEKSAAGEVSSRTNQFKSQQYNLNYRQLKVTTTKNRRRGVERIKRGEERSKCIVNVV